MTRTKERTTVHLAPGVVTGRKLKRRELAIIRAAQAFRTHADKHGIIRRALFRLVLVAIVFTGIVAASNAQLLDPALVTQFVLGFGPFSPLIWIALYLGAVFVPYAASVMTIAAGLAFGTVPGLLMAYFTTIFASLIPFSVSRRLGRKWVESRVGNTRVQRYVNLINRHAFLVFFYLRLLPSLPYELQNYVAGVTRITRTQFFLASVLGNGPVLLVMVFLGSSLTEPGSAQFWIAAGLYSIVLLTPLVLLLIRKRTGRSLFLQGLSS